ncbi:hypothetical protein JXJ21_03735 [candidate division KSB1 bacterium]|nr:hypothetical protein [candidate division KSB1 bacterium]
MSENYKLHHLSGKWNLQGCLFNFKSINTRLKQLLLNSAAFGKPVQYLFLAIVQQVNVQRAFGKGQKWLFQEHLTHTGEKVAHLSRFLHLFEYPAGYISEPL